VEEAAVSVGPLPPALVETAPMQGSELPLSGPLTLYFNQPMDTASVESALSAEPALRGSYTWEGENATLVFTPAEPWEPATEVTIILDTLAQASNGLALSEPVSLQFTTTGYLQLTQNLPADAATGADPSSAVVAAFNRPVVPLGADPEGLEPAFTISPAVSGRGEWLNTSTYIFYPDPPLEGGKDYAVNLSSDLQSTDGVPMEQVEGWTFSTAFPRLVSAQPEDDEQFVYLDAEIVLEFNQAMDSDSMAANFDLVDAVGRAVTGDLTWSEDQRTFTFTPDALLGRSAEYTFVLDGDVQASGGTPLGSDFRATFTTVGDMAVIASDPVQGGEKYVYAPISFTLSAPLDLDTPNEWVTVEPDVSSQIYFSGRELNISGFFDAETDYTVTLSAALADAWGDTLGEPYVLNFSTASLEPQLNFSSYYGAGVLFVPPDDPELVAQVVNIDAATLEVGSVPLIDFISLNQAGAYEQLRSYLPDDLQSWQQPLDLASNRSQLVSLGLTPEGDDLTPGLYWVSISAPELVAAGQYVQPPFFVVSSNVHLTYKISATDALVWAVDLRDGNPVAGEAVSILDSSGYPLAQGETDEQGLFQASFAPQSDPYANTYAVLGEAGDEYFSLATSNWNYGLTGWDFDITFDPSPPGLKTYIYTDRPIYRPGQTVYFRAVARQAYNGRYSLPDIGTLPFTVYQGFDQELTTLDLPLSEFGTVNGSFTLPETAKPGYYRIASDLDDGYSGVDFQVAEYRKPEIDLQVSFSEAEIEDNQSLTGLVEANYFFSAPAGSVDFQWALYGRSSSFSLPDYSVGTMDTDWMSWGFYSYGFDSLGALISSGDERTRPDGSFTLELPVEESDDTQIYTLEITIQDESGLPVSARAEATVHPADFYIGVSPEAWVGQADQQIAFKIQAVDWEGVQAGEHALLAEFSKVVWQRSELNRFGFYEYTPVYTLVDSLEFETDADGMARVAFIPPDPGTYQLQVSGEGAVTQTLVWVGGAGQAIWPNLSDNHIELTLDEASYQPGDTASVFIPNPLGVDTLALVTIERGVVLHQPAIVDMDGSGLTFEVVLTEDDAPNVYLSVTLVGEGEDGMPEYRQGYINIPVEPVAQTLNVELVGEPQQAGPGDEITFTVQVTDSDGDPVQGEFSLSLVDLAVLALADPNAPAIVPAFYGTQALGVRSNITLSAAASRYVFGPDGLGGGGDEAVAPLREDFEDTAYWNAEIVTDAQGMAQVTVRLPDNLTTWQVNLRGLTADTLVGEAEMQVVTSKPLLVRPVVPRFLVVGDHAQLAAVVHNNSEDDLQVDVAIQATGFELDDPATAIQQVAIPAGGRAQLVWWGTVQEVESVGLVYAAEGGGLRDLTRPASGLIPVLHYIAPTTFATSGTLDQGGQRLEVISLPRSYDPTSGELNLEMAPSLAAALLAGLDVLEQYPYACTEQTVTRFLPNLEFYRALQDFGLESPALEARLERTLDDGVQRLLSLQNTDGGWGWWSGRESEPYVSAYALFGLVRAREAGVTVPAQAIDVAVDYLLASLPDAGMLTETWQLDRLAFVHFVLTEVGEGSLAGAAALYTLRDQLDPWAQAMLALTLEMLSPGDERVDTLISDLNATAVRSATGAHWELIDSSGYNMSSSVHNTAVVIYALAQQDPAAPLLADAVRYLMAQRSASGWWNSTYASAWAFMSLAEFMRGTGELSADFAFSAELNGSLLASGQAGGAGQLAPVTATVGIEDLLADQPNALSIQRDPGEGRLYYRASLQVSRPVEEVAPLSRGMSVARAYYPSAEDCPEGDCASVSSAQAGDLLTVRVTLTLPNEVYYLVVEDYFPAGAEVLDTRLKTSQQGVEPEYDAQDPFGEGWGWWFFGEPEVYDDHIAWATDYLPAGTYELVYTLAILQPGEYQVLPARAWEFYFPEVQGAGAGMVLEIDSAE